MKIAIASSGKDIKSKVSPISGRAEFFLIFEGKKLVKTIKNPFLFGGGAGTSVAQMLCNEKVNLVVAGHFGDKMISALEKNKIKRRVMKDISVSEAIKLI